MPNPGRGVRLRGNALTSTGKVRENNEDHVFLWDSDSFMLAIVADGMGGAVAGEEASRIAVQTIEHGLFQNSDQPREQMYDEVPADVLSDRLREVIRTANANIVQQTVNSPHLRGMGTTITLALVRSTYAVIGHVGDSRAYLVDGQDGSISQITSDHSFVEAMVAAGHITREEAEDHPMRNVLYRALGQAEDVDVDVYHSYLRAGDRLILCSDGLTLHVKPEEIAQGALADRTPEAISRKLVELANSRGGRDNVSVITIIVEEDGVSSADSDTAKVKTPVEDETVILRERERGAFVSSESKPSERVEPHDSHASTSFAPRARANESALAFRLRREPDSDYIREGSDALRRD